MILEFIISMATWDNLYLSPIDRESAPRVYKTGHARRFELLLPKWTVSQKLPESSITIRSNGRYWIQRIQSLT